MDTACVLSRVNTLQREPLQIAKHYVSAFPMHYQLFIRPTDKPGISYRSRYFAKTTCQCSFLRLTTFEEKKNSNN